MGQTHPWIQRSSLPIISPQEGPLQKQSHTYDLLRQCIHCGFCLPVCPTYAVLGIEMDSPRGRIYQMRAVADGKLQLSEDFIEHMDCCVGCRACETACPSGVQYGKLIEAAHEHIQIARAHTAVEENDGTITQTESDGDTLPQKLLYLFFFRIMLRSRIVLSLVFGGLKLYQRSKLQTIVHKSGLFDAINNLPGPFQGKLAVPEALVADVQGDILPGQLPEIVPAIGIKRYRVGFISGCIMDQTFRAVNEATIRVLTANGCEVVTPPQQNCCGALHVHSGEAEQSRALARQNIDAFAPYECDFIIINSAGCGSTLKEYDHLLRDDTVYAERAQSFRDKVVDIHEFLAAYGTSVPMGTLQRTVAYHDACHLLHGQKIKQQPRQLLQAIPGIILVNLKESDWCCGSAGIYNITHQDMAQELLDRKMNNIEASGATMIATGNPGCMMQISMGAKQRDIPLEVVHPIQLLDEAYREGHIYDTTAPLWNDYTQQLRGTLLLAGFGLAAVLLLLSRRRK
jgi:glycolate oxidase iron-sulfur subunit